MPLLVALLPVISLAEDLPLLGRGERPGSGPPLRYEVPGDLLHVETVLVYDETWDSEFSFYHYSHVFDVPFVPLPWHSYWIAIQAVLDFPPQWMWAESAPEYDWGEEGVLRGEVFGIPDWTPFSIINGTYSELAFRIHTAQGVLATKLPLAGGGYWSSQEDPGVIVSECAEDFLSDSSEPITGVEWWGDYYNGNPSPPALFYVRIYDGVPTATADTSWGQVKTLY